MGRNTTRCEVYGYVNFSDLRSKFISEVIWLLKFSLAVCRRDRQCKISTVDEIAHGFAQNLLSKKTRLYQIARVTRLYRDE